MHEGHVDAIRAKCVKPEEGTVLFAFGFIPSEAVCQYLTECAMGLLVDAAKDGVLLVSPATTAVNLNLFAVGLQASEISERAGMRKICESKIDSSILQAVAELEKLGWVPFMLAVPRYNKRMLKATIPEVKRILSQFSYPNNRRIAGAHGHFTMENYERWLEQAGREDLALGLSRLAQLNQTKVYLSWQKK